MNNAIPSLHDAHLAFVGRMIAGVAHEFKNHLSVTKELSGLLDDLLAVESSVLPGADRLAKITAGIEERVAAAAEMANHLGRFAHRMDQALASFSVNEVVGEVVFLTRRFARLKNIDLIMDPAPELPPLHSNPSLLQFVVFSVIMPMLDHLDKGGAVRITTGLTAGRIRLSFHFDKIRADRPGSLAGIIHPDALRGLQAVFADDRPAGTDAPAHLLLSEIPRDTAGAS